MPVQFSNIIKLITDLIEFISLKRKRQFIYLIILAIIASIAEIISLGSVLPFIQILIDPSKLLSNHYFSIFLSYFNIVNSSDLVIFLSIIFILTAFLAGLLRLFLLKISVRFSHDLGTDISILAYKKTIHQPYSVHIERSTNELISGITQKVSATTGVIISLVTITTSIFLFISIFILLLYVDYIIALFSAFVFGSIYTILAFYTKKKISSNSFIIANEQTNVVKSLQEGLGSIRDIILDSSHDLYIHLYEESFNKLQNANRQNSFLSQAPRFFLETVGIILIAITVIILNNERGGIISSFPLLATLAISAQRLLPLMQLIYGNWSNIIGNKSSLNDVLNLLKLPVNDQIHDDGNLLLFFDKIRLDNIAFKYNSTQISILNNINLEIESGSRIGIIGETGSGKSTLVDIIMGLLMPTNGSIFVDENLINYKNIRKWQGLVSHVPQNIFLKDASIIENIAFGVPENLIDIERVKIAAKQAQISSFIESRPLGYYEIVGERGINLSGGQRQRIGIARALYKNSKILIFDEATSALDSDTESDLMTAIENLDKELTILIIAHRISTLKNCSKIIQLKNGEIINVCNYLETLNNLKGLTPKI
jgi:ABC-type multidrug transport system fused ATPase/permease subunit